MDNRRFGEAYPPLATPVVPSNPDRREILAEPRRWMRYFEENLDAYLQDGQVPDEEDFTRQSELYCNWANRYAEGAYQGLIALGDHSAPNNVESQINFHRHNRTMIFFWNDLFYPDRPLRDADNILSFQQHMAVSSVEPAQRLAFLNKLASPENQQERGILIGYLTEVDTAITLMELMKRHPELIAIPAPLRYEHRREDHQLNSDFLLFDRDKRQARGIQVKGSIRSTDRILRYDSEYVTLVDGAHDLGSTVFDKRQRAYVEHPGEVALGILADTPIKAPPAFMPRLEFMRRRQIAKEILSGRRSQLDMAVRQVGHRVLHDLYLQPSDEADCLTTGTASRT